MLKKIQTKSI